MLTPSSYRGIARVLEAVLSCSGRFKACVDIGSYSNAREEGMGDWKDGMLEESKTQNGIVEYHCTIAFFYCSVFIAFFPGGRLFPPNVPVRQGIALSFFESRARGGP
jgi:hypothetical protein